MRISAELDRALSELEMEAVLTRDVQIIERPLIDKLYDIACQDNIAEDRELSWTKSQWALIEHGIALGQARLARLIVAGEADTTSLIAYLTERNIMRNSPDGEV